MIWFMVFNAISIIFQLYCGGQFYWWRKPEYQKKTTNLSQVIDTLYYIMLYRATIMDKITEHLYFASLKNHEKRTNLRHYFHYKWYNFAFFSIWIYPQSWKWKQQMCGKSYLLCYTFITLTMYLLIFSNQSHLKLNDTCPTYITMLIRVVHTRKYPKNKIIWQYHYILYFIIVS